MTEPFLSLDRMAELYTFERDWLFEKFLVKLNTQRHLILTADQQWGIQEYVKELGFQLEENHRDIHICYVDVQLAQTSLSFLNLFQTSLLHKFQEVGSLGEGNSGSLNSLKLPSIIARKKKIRVGVFLSNSHLFHRFKDADSFLRTLRLYFQIQKKCVFCMYGNDTSYFRELVHAPGPLSGLGQLFELRHDQTKHRSASIRKLFHDHNKRIAYTTSIHMSYAVDNHSIYLKLLAWHALIRTRNLCTMKTVDEALNDLILHYEPHFLKTVENLTIKQLRYLKAGIEVGYKLCSEAVLQAYQLESSGHVARIRQSLVKKEIIARGKHATGNPDTVFSDPVFREWLRNRYFKIDSVPHSSPENLEIS